MTLELDYLKDSKLSFKAKGLLAYMLLIENKKLTRKDLRNSSRDSHDSISSGFKELQRNGYVSSQLQKGTDGRFEGYDYEISGSKIF